MNSWSSTETTLPHGKTKEEFDKIEISEEILKTLTMEDLWNSPRLRSYVEKKYPRVYLNLTKPVREIKLAQFLYHAQAQENAVKAMANLAPYTETSSIVDSAPAK